MKRPMLGLWTAAAGLAAVLLLGQLPGWEQGLQERRRAVAAMAPRSPLLLSDDNLPDAFTALRFREKLTGVGWDHSILTVDLTLRDPAAAEAEYLWEDLSTLIRFSFADTGNVRQLLYRVYAEERGRRQLMLYGDSRREDWRDGEAAGLRAPDAASLPRFRGKIRMSLTPAGEKWLRI